MSPSIYLLFLPLVLTELSSLVDEDVHEATRRFEELFFKGDYEEAVKVFDPQTTVQILRNGREEVTLTSRDELVQHFRQQKQDRILRFILAEKSVHFTEEGEIRVDGNIDLMKYDRDVSRLLGYDNGAFEAVWSSSSGQWLVRRMQIRWDYP